MFTLPEMLYQFTETVTGFIHMTTFNLGVKQFQNNTHPVRRNVQLQSGRLHCELLGMPVRILRGESVPDARRSPGKCFISRKFDMIAPFI